MIKADLHSHTHFSDGTLSPQQLLSRAAERGVTHLAITDHDYLSRPAPDTINSIANLPHLIDGVEISSLWNGREIHVVGLFVSASDSALKALLLQQQLLRWQRVERFDQHLQGAGISGLLSWLEQLPCQAVSRSHVADFLVDKGKAKSRQQAFKRLIGAQGRFRVSAQWCSLQQAVAHIVAAGGIAVLAHPDRYQLTNTRLRSLIGDFGRSGGEAMEVSYSNLHPDKARHLANLAEEFALWASAGSDFHDPARHWMDVGKIAPLPPVCRDRAIWHHPVWQQHFSA
jgi:predicted metal-dependent phosphoesterase TrpH